jgi:penicillin-binding protein 1A
MRKLLEAILALQIEKRFTKEEILEMYFNQIYLGHGCYGVAAAAQLFFNKEVQHLNVAESAVLAALPSAPGRHSPLKNPRTACRVNHEILGRMVDNDFLTRDRAEKVYQEFWPAYIDSIKTEYPSKTVFSKTDNLAPHFTDYVRQILLSRFGKDIIYNEGLNVYTTLNLRRQEAAERHLTKGVREQNRVSTLANTYYLSAVDTSLFGAYEVLRSVFSLPGVIVRNDIETTFKKQMVDDLLDSADILSLLVDDRASNHTISRSGKRSPGSLLRCRLKAP